MSGPLILRMLNRDNFVIGKFKPGHHNLTYIYRTISRITSKFGEQPGPLIKLCGWSNIARKVQMCPCKTSYCVDEFRSTGDISQSWI